MHTWKKRRSINAFKVFEWCPIAGSMTLNQTQIVSNTQNYITIAVHMDCPVKVEVPETGFFLHSLKAPSSWHLNEWPFKFHQSNLGTYVWKVKRVFVFINTV